MNIRRKPDSRLIWIPGIIAFLCLLAYGTWMVLNPPVMYVGCPASIQTQSDTFLCIDGKLHAKVNVGNGQAFLPVDNEKIMKCD